MLEILHKQIEILYKEKQEIESTIFYKIIGYGSEKIIIIDEVILDLKRTIMNYIKYQAIR